MYVYKRGMTLYIDVNETFNSRIRCSNMPGGGGVKKGDLHLCLEYIYLIIITNSEHTTFKLGGGGGGYTGCIFEAR